jgi:hypothetical protein
MYDSMNGCWSLVRLMSMFQDLTKVAAALAWSPSEREVVLQLPLRQTLNCSPHFYVKLRFCSTHETSLPKGGREVTQRLSVLHLEGDLYHHCLQAVAFQGREEFGLARQTEGQQR